MRGYVAVAVGEGGGVAEHVVVVVAVVPGGGGAAAPGGVLAVGDDLTDACLLQRINLLRAPGAADGFFFYHQLIDAGVVELILGAVGRGAEDHAAGTVVRVVPKSECETLASRWLLVSAL